MVLGRRPVRCWGMRPVAAPTILGGQLLDGNLRCFLIRQNPWEPRLRTPEHFAPVCTSIHSICTGHSKLMPEESGSRMKLSCSDPTTSWGFQQGQVVAAVSAASVAGREG